MRIAHAAIATPHRCGLWETTRELVAAERAMGVDARVVDPAPNETAGVKGEDRGVPIADMDWGVTADLVVSHSGHDRTPLADTDQPIIHVSHGRPLSTWMGERSGGAPGLTYQTQRKTKDRYRAVVTFWPEYEPYLRSIWAPKPVYTIPAPADLSYWTPGHSAFNFHGKKGRYNVIITDPWSREDATVYHAVHAFVLFQKIVPHARLHMFAWDRNKKGLTGLTNLLGVGGGIIAPWVTNMREVMRAADMLISTNRIYTRSIREAMACGLQVVSGRDCHPEDIEQFALTMVRRMENPQPTRKMAEALFDPKQTAMRFLEAVEKEVAVCCGD